MGFSIIELVSNISMYNFIKDIIIPFFGAIGGVVSCFIAFKVYYREYKPKIALDYDIKQNNKFDLDIINQYLSTDEIENAGLGFNKSNDDSYNIYLKIKNNSTHPITNFKLIYELILYKKNLEFTEYGLEFNDLGYDEFKKVRKEINIDYIPPEKEITKWIYISSIIPKCKIDIILANSTENKYFKRRFTLVVFDVFDYVGIQDSPHYRRLHGL